MTDQQVDLRFAQQPTYTSLVTTSVYLHGEGDARYRASQASHRIGWN
ncbi:hypothetical protein [Ralstonia sp. A12]